MYESLKRHSSDFHLYIFAFDDLTFEILGYLKLQDVTAIPLKDLENPDLLRIKPGRSIAEYCWTCTPATILYVLDMYKTDHCTYVDADLCFYADPSVLVRELITSSKSVMITEHRYSRLPKIYSEKKSGRFCVQFLTFKNEPESLTVLKRWYSQCLEWCFARYEDGKFGDQKYLDSWPYDYNNIHILENQGGGVAPWNTGQFTFGKENDNISLRRKENNKTFSVVFYHFQYVKFLEDGLVDIGWYYMNDDVKTIFYLPYLSDVKRIELMLTETFPSYKPALSRPAGNTLKDRLKIAFKNNFAYNILRIE